MTNKEEYGRVSCVRCFSLKKIVRDLDVPSETKTKITIEAFRGEENDSSYGYEKRLYWLCEDCLDVVENEIESE